MKRRSILALILVTMLVVSISLIGCGRNYSGTGSGTGANSGSDTGSGAGTRTGGGSGTGTGADGGSGTGTGTDGGSGTGTNSTVREDVKGTVDSVRGGIDDAGNALNYTATNFRDDFVNAGYKLTDSANSKQNYFTGNETDYLAGNDVVRVYEYNSANDLENDISRIASNGLTINGTNANYTRMPNYYRKGNSLIVYEGSEPSYTDQFKTMYGNPIIP